MSPQFQKQISVLSIPEIERFQSWVDEKLRKDSSSLKQRDHLKNLRFEINEYLRSVREKL